MEPPPDGSPLRVMLLEDSPTFARFLQAALASEGRGQFDVSHVSTVGEAERWLHAQVPDAILMDLGLPDCSGIETFRRVRSAAPEVPVVVLTGTYEEEHLALTALRDGAQDYLMKGEVTPAGLVRALRYAHERKRVQDRIRQAERERAELEQLREVDRLKTGLINTATHQFNTPLTPMLTELHLLDRSDRASWTPKQREALVAIARSARRLQRLALLFEEAAMVQAGRVWVVPMPVDLAEVVRESLAGVSAAARAQGVRLAGPELPGPLVHADPPRVRRVLAGLLDNAVRFTPQGGAVEVTIAEEGGAGVVRVRDEGVGLAPEEARRLFDALEGDAARANTAGAGPRLDLYICAALVKAHSGRIWAESAGPGKGATFAFTLPLAPLGSERAVALGVATPARRLTP